MDADLERSKRVIELIHCSEDLDYGTTVKCSLPPPIASRCARAKQHPLPFPQNARSCRPSREHQCRNRRGPAYLPYPTTQPLSKDKDLTEQTRSGAPWPHLYCTLGSSNVRAAHVILRNIERLRRILPSHNPQSDSGRRPRTTQLYESQQSRSSITCIQNPSTVLYIVRRVLMFRFEALSMKNTNGDLTHSCLSPPSICLENIQAWLYLLVDSTVNATTEHSGEERNSKKRYATTVLAHRSTH